MYIQFKVVMDRGESRRTGLSCLKLNIWPPLSCWLNGDDGRIQVGQHYIVKVNTSLDMSAYDMSATNQLIKHPNCLQSCR